MNQGCSAMIENTRVCKVRSGRKEKKVLQVRAGPRMGRAIHRSAVQVFVGEL